MNGGCVWVSLLYKIQEALQVWSCLRSGANKCHIPQLLRREKTVPSLACTANQGQLPGPVSSESGKVEGSRERGGPIPSSEETPHPAAVFAKRGFCLLEEHPPSGRPCPVERPHSHLCPWLSCLDCTQVFVRNPLVSAAKRCVAPTSCQTEQRCHANSRGKPLLEFTGFTANFKVTSVTERAQGQIHKTPSFLVALV